MGATSGLLKAFLKFGISIIRYDPIQGMLLIGVCGEKGSERYVLDMEEQKNGWDGNMKG